MRTWKNEIATRKSKRDKRFGILKKVPSRKSFCRSKKYVELMITFLFVTGISIAVLYYNSDFLGLSLLIYLAVISLFGYAVKLTLSLLFPIVILNKTGIKFFNSKTIKWAEIKSIEVNSNSNLEQVVYITKFNSKLIKKNLEKDYFPGLHLYCRSFQRKYKENNESSRKLS